jgi:hypothetical protein
MLHPFDGVVSRRDSARRASHRKKLSSLAIFDSDCLCDRLHFARAMAVVGGAHHPCPEMELSAMAALAILVGIGFF